MNIYTKKFITEKSLSFVFCVVIFTEKSLSFVFVVMHLIYIKIE